MPSSFLVYLFQASLDAAVLAGNPFAVPVICSTTCHAQIWVTLPHSQVAGTLFCVTLSLTPAAWETVLTWKTFRRMPALKENVLGRFVSKLHQCRNTIHHMNWQNTK